MTDLVEKAVSGLKHGVKSVKNKAAATDLSSFTMEEDIKVVKEDMVCFSDDLEI